MSKLEIRGIIVPSMYDSQSFWPYIQRGIITPESYFRKQLKQLSPKEPLEVYVNSQGGSVFSGNEMINAIRDWKLENNQPVNFTVGAISASMASAMLVFAADKVRVHQNSKIMFHGALTETEGGEGAHKDALELVGKMNAELKTVLVSRYKLPPESVDTWFEEGRMGWLSAVEAKKIGLADEIIEQDDKENAEEKIMVRQMEQGMKIAACLENINKTKEEEIMLKKLIAMLGLAENTAEADLEKFVTTLKKPEDVKIAAESAYDEGKTAGTVEGRKAAELEIAARVKEYEDKLKDFSGQISAKSLEIENLKKANSEISAKHEKLAAGLKAPEGEAPTGKAGFFALVDIAVSEGASKEDAMLKIQREHPELFKQMLSESNKK